MHTPFHPRMSSFITWKVPSSPNALVWDFSLCWQHFPLLCLSLEVEMSVGRDTVWLERRWGKPGHLVSCQCQSSGQSRIMLVFHALPLLVRGGRVRSHSILILMRSVCFSFKLKFLRRLRLQEGLRRQIQGEDGRWTLSLEMQNRRAFHRPGKQGHRGR